MKSLVSPLLALAAAVLPAIGGPRPIPADAVVVVFNSTDAESKELAEHYRRARGIPSENIIGLPLPNSGTINRSVYESQLRGPLIAKFNQRGWWDRSRDAAGLLVPTRNKIRVLACMRGVPWRIQRSPIPPPVNEDGKQTKFRPVPLQDEAAIDSELAMLGVDKYETRGPLRSPYFQKDASILDAGMDAILLVTRLDGPTAAQARRLIDDAAETERDGLWGMAYLDLALKGKTYKTGDDWIEEIATRNAEKGIPTVIDRNRDTFVTNYPMTRAALYFGWYAPHRDGPFLNPEFRFKRGAVAVHLHSFSAADLRAPERHWVGPLVARGAAATLGNTWEPYLHLTHHFDTFHDRLLKGYTLAEAAYMAAPALSWQGLVIGDPLYRPYARFADADANSSEDQEFKTLRAIHLDKGDDLESMQTAVRSAAARTKNGFLYEALGLSFREQDRDDVATASFESARRHFSDPADQLRQDLHIADIARQTGRKNEAIAHLRGIEAQYKDTPGARAITGLLNIDPPAAPACRSRRRRRQGRRQGQGCRKERRDPGEGEEWAIGRGQKSEVGSQQSVVRSQLSVVGSQKDLAESPPSNIQHPTSNIRHPTSDIEHRTSNREPRTTNRAMPSPSSLAARSSRYAGLRATSGVVAEDPRPLPRELELQALWFAGAFGRDFVTAHGQKVRIVQFGEWNHAAGPDFLHAAIDLDGTIHSGPLELDTHPADWEAHGHATNPAFNDVILHVVFTTGSRTHFSRSSEGRDIPSVIVPSDRLDDALGRPVTSQAASHLGRCSVPLHELPADRVHDLLLEAARFRLAHKGTQLAHLEDSHGFEEALWQSLARALGYGPNKLAMTLLAQRASRRRLRDLRTNSTREALLFGLAGFLAAGLHQQCPPDSRRYLGVLWNDWWKLRPDHEPDPARALPWTFAGLRPQNHPHRRLGALAAISTDWKKIATPAQTHTPARLKTLTERLTALDHDFWSTHYTLTAKPAAKPLALFGKSRVHEFLANYYLPGWARHDADAAVNAYRKLPAGTLSDAVRRAATRLLGDRPDRDAFLKKLWQHQALLQIYHDFCLQDASDCTDCPFPEQLAQW